MRKLRDQLHHFFVPGKHNNHCAVSVSHSFLTLVAILAVLSVSFLPNLKYQSGSILGFATDIVSEKVLEETNHERILNGLSPLRENPMLSAAAQAKAQDMFEKGYWAHFGPNGETPWQFILAQGYEYEYAGENLAKSFLDSKSVVVAWMNSPTHRDNILNNHYSDVGYAIANGVLNDEDTTLVVQMFGKVAGGTTAQSQDENGSSGLVSQVKAESTKVEIPMIETNVIPTTVADSQKNPAINLLPVYQFLAGVLVAFLILAFCIDLYHLSKTNFQRHRGKHIAHLIFLLASLIGIFMLGKGAIL